MHHDSPFFFIYFLHIHPSMHASILIPFKLCKNIKGMLDVYEADGYYIKDCIDSNRDKHVYIDEDLCYYNFLK